MNLLKSKSKVLSLSSCVSYCYLAPQLPVRQNLQGKIFRYNNLRSARLLQSQFKLAIHRESCLIKDEYALTICTPLSLTSQTILYR